MQSRVQINQNYRRTPSASPPPSHSTYQHVTIAPPIEPETYLPPTSHPRSSLPPTGPNHTSQPTVLISSPLPRPYYDLPEPANDFYTTRQSMSRYRHSRSLSSASSSSSHSFIPSSSSSSRSVSPASSVSSTKSVRFAEKLEFEPVREREREREQVGGERGWEYVSSRGMAYHPSDVVGRGRRREPVFADSLVVVEKARRHRRRHSDRVEEVARQEVVGERYW